MPHESFCLTSELQRWPLRKFCPYSIIVYHTFHRGWQFLSHFSHFIMLSMGVVLHRLFSNWLDWHWLRIFRVHPQRLLFSTWAHLVWSSAAEKHSLRKCKWMIHAPNTCKICTAHNVDFGQDGNVQECQSDPIHRELPFLWWFYTIFQLFIHLSHFFSQHCITCSTHKFDWSWKYEYK